MRDKLQILTITLIALSLAMLIGLSQQLTQSHTYYVPNYALTEQEYQQVEQAKGTFVQVDVLKYGDNAVPYQRSDVSTLHILLFRMPQERGHAHYQQEVAKRE